MMVSGASAGGGADIPGDYAVAPSPPSLAKIITGAGYIVTGSTTVTPGGGTGPYTYLWTCDDDQVQPQAGTAATTTFRRYMLNGDSSFAIATCTVTDSLGAVGYGTVTLSLRSTANGDSAIA